MSGAWHQGGMKGCPQLAAVLCTVCKRPPVAKQLQQALVCHVVLCVAITQEELVAYLCGRPPGVP